MPPRSKATRYEIQEYSYLLRALKSASTADLAEHVVLEPRREALRRSTELEGHDDSTSVKELWTRWPLMANDVYPPSWSLEEEIISLAASSLSSEHYGSELQELEELPPSVTSALAASTMHVLSQSFAHLAANSPLVDKKSQGRLQPSGWQEVLSIIDSECIFPSE